MRNDMPGDEEYTREDDEQRTNDELLTVLREEYEEALLAKDQDRIDDQIAPRFWSRFAPYFNQYEVLWEDPERDEHPDHKPRYMLDRAYLGKVQAGWMDQVLRGEIEIGDEMDEEPSEY